jgi:hypothetical protein
VLSVRNFDYSKSDRGILSIRFAVKLVREEKLVIMQLELNR